jgi:hypothetical protein
MVARHAAFLHFIVQAPQTDRNCVRLGLLDPTAGQRGPAATSTAGSFAGTVFV